MEEPLHLTEIETALFAEYLMGTGRKYSEIPEVLTEHLEDCNECRKKVMEICDIIPLLGSFLDDDQIMWVKDSVRYKRNWFNGLLRKVSALFLQILNFILPLTKVHLSAHALPNHG